MALNIRIYNPEKTSSFYISHQRENTRRQTKRNLFLPGHRPLYLHPADTFHRICNPMVLNIRIYNPGKTSSFYISHQRENAQRQTKRNLFFPGHRPLYLYAADCKSAETDTETTRNDRHGKHTLSQVGNPVLRSTGQYFAGSTRVLPAEYADALRTACPRFPQFASPSSSASSSFPVPSVRSVPLPVPSDLQSDGAKYKDL